MFLPRAQSDPADRGGRGDGSHPTADAICFSARRVGKHALGPAWTGSGNHRPVRLIARNAFAKWPHAARDDLLHRTDEFGRLVLKRVGIVGVDREDGVTGLSVLQQRIRQPGGELVERIAWRVPVAQELKRFVTPERFDVSCSGAIRALRDPCGRAEPRRATRRRWQSDRR